MADSSIPRTNDTSGTLSNIDTFTQSNGDHRQAIVLGDASAASTAGVSTAGNLNVHDPDTSTTGTFTAVTQTVTLAVNGRAGLGIQVTGTFVATVVFEATIDGTLWFGILGSPTIAGADVSTTSAPGAWRAGAGTYTSMRVRCTAYTSGTVNVTLVATQAGNGVYLLETGEFIDLDVTTTGSITATDAAVAAPGGAGGLTSGTPTAGSYVSSLMQGGESGFILQATGTFGGGTLWVEASNSSTNGVDGSWTTLTVRMLGNGAATVLGDSVTAAGAYRGNLAGFGYLRVRLTGATSPSLAIVLRAGAGSGSTVINGSLPPGSNAIGSVAINAALPAGTNSIGAVTQAPRGTFTTGRATATATTTGTSIIAAPGAGLSIYITDFVVSNSGTVASLVSLLPAAGTSVLDIVAGATGGGGSVSLQTPIKIAANTALHYAVATASTTLYITVSGYIAA